TPTVLSTTGIQMTIVGRLHVGDMQESIPPDAEIDEGRLDARLDVDDTTLVNVTDIAFMAGTFDIQLFEDAVFDDGDSTFLGLQYVDQHLLLHKLPFQIKLMRASGAWKRLGDRSHD